MNAVYMEQKDLAESIIGKEDVERNRRHAARRITEARAIMNLARAELNQAGFETSELREIEDALKDFDHAMFG